MHVYHPAHSHSYTFQGTRQGVPTLGWVFLHQLAQSRTSPRQDMPIGCVELDGLHR